MLEGGFSLSASSVALGQSAVLGVRVLSAGHARACGACEPPLLGSLQSVGLVCGRLFAVGVSAASLASVTGAAEQGQRDIYPRTDALRVPHGALFLVCAVGVLGAQLYRGLSSRSSCFWRVRGGRANWL